MVRLYPKALIYNQTIENGIGNFNPCGITIHYTAGGTAVSSIEYLRTTSLRYHLIIDRNGDIYQMVRLDQRVNHAGDANWQGLSPNRKHIAIALANYGKLELQEGKFLTWSGQSMNQTFVEYRPFTLSHGSAYWEKCTKAQESSLVDLIYWLMKNLNISPKHICGHDEATPRKIDPGGCLSFSVSELRSIAESYR